MGLDRAHLERRGPDPEPATRTSGDGPDGAVGVMSQALAGPESGRLLGAAPSPDEAITLLARFPGSPAEKAQLLERLAKELSSRIGNWSAERFGTAGDGSIVYAGATVKRSDRPMLVIKADGTIATGVLGTHVTVGAADHTITCHWDVDGWKTWR